MGPRIDGPGFNPQVFTHTEKLQDARALQGEYKGEKVQQEGKSVMSMIHDAAEELTFVHSETQSKKLAERKSTTRKAGLDEATMEMYQKLLKSVPDMGSPDKLAGLLESIKKGKPTPDQLRQQLGEQYEDVSHQYAALQFLEEALTQQNAPPESLATVREARRQLEQEKGPEIRAGLNVSLEAHKFSEQGVGSSQELRDFYRDTVLKFEDAEQAFEAILGQYGREKFADAAEFLIRGIGHDIEAMGPSRDKEELHAINRGLKSVQHARNLYIAFDDLLGKMQKQFGLGL
jgi:type III secretion protein W